MVNRPYEIHWREGKPQPSWHHHGQILMVLLSDIFLGMHQVFEQSPWIPCPGNNLTHSIIQILGLWRNVLLFHNERIQVYKDQPHHWYLCLLLHSLLLMLAPYPQPSDMVVVWQLLPSACRLDIRLQWHQKQYLQKNARMRTSYCLISVQTSICRLVKCFCQVELIPVRW
jgi:hypothetical protein